AWKPEQIVQVGGIVVNVRENRVYCVWIVVISHEILLLWRLGCTVWGSIPYFKWLDIGEPLIHYRNFKLESTTMMGSTPILIAAQGVLFVFLTGCTCTKPQQAVLDEAKQAQLEAKDFPAADEDYFHD